MTYFEFLATYGGRLIDGTIVTAQQTVLAIVVAVVISLLMGLLRMAHNMPARALATVYIEFFRGTSLVVQLFWIFYVLPLLGFTLDKFTAGFVAVGMNLGAYGAEVVRGAVQSVPRGQYEAALAINMSQAMRMLRIIFPQAILLMLPQVANLTIELLKGTALVALISVADLMFEARQVNGSTFLSVQTFGTALVIYYVMGRFIISPVMRYLEAAMARKMGRT